jgi:hypothetical protein
LSQHVAFELEVPDDLARFRLPPGVQARLQTLLDRQDDGATLTAAEREEAQGLVPHPRLFFGSSCFGVPRNSLDLQGSNLKIWRG